MLHSAVPSHHHRATGDKAYQRQIPDNYLRFPGLLHEAPDLVSLFFFFFLRVLLRVVPAFPRYPTVAAATCHGPIQTRQNNDVLLPSMAAQLDFRI